MSGTGAGAKGTPLISDDNPLCDKICNPQPRLFRSAGRAVHTLEGQAKADES